MPCKIREKRKPYINPFHTTGLFLYSLKTSENLWFSDVSRGFRKRPVARNGLKKSSNKKTTAARANN